MNLYVSKKLMQSYDCEDLRKPFTEDNGKLIVTSERHFLHKAIGLLGKETIAKFGVEQTTLQSFISDRDAYSLLKIGVLQVCSEEEYYSQRDIVRLSKVLKDTCSFFENETQDDKTLAQMIVNIKLLKKLNILK